MNNAFTIGKNWIAGYFNSQPFTVDDSHPNFKAIKQAIKDKAYHLIDDLVNVAKSLNTKMQGTNVQIVDGEVLYKGKAINNAVCDKIIEFKREGFDIQPLCRFLDNLMENPSFKSREQLWSYIERYKFPVTDDGCFLAMKAVNPDLWDKFTGKTFKHDIGAVAKMPRTEVSDDSNVGCHVGFHAGSQIYIMQYGDNDSMVVLVKIDPKNVCSCPADHSYQKLRCCEYEVISHIGTVQEVRNNGWCFTSNSAANQASLPEETVKQIHYHNKRDSLGRFCA